MKIDFERLSAVLPATELVEVLKNEVARLRGDADIARLRLEAACAEITRLRLTDAEREALHHVVGDVADITGPVEDTIRGLLERCATSTREGRDE